MNEQKPPPPTDPTAINQLWNNPDIIRQRLTTLAREQAKITKEQQALRKILRAICRFKREIEPNNEAP